MPLARALIVKSGPRCRDRPWREGDRWRRVWRVRKPKASTHGAMAFVAEIWRGSLMALALLPLRAVSISVSDDAIAVSWPTSRPCAAASSQPSLSMAKSAAMRRVSVAMVASCGARPGMACLQQSDVNDGREPCIGSRVTVRRVIKTWLRAERPCRAKSGSSAFN